MYDEPPSPGELDRLRTIAEFQFGADAGAVLFPDDGDFAAHRTTSDRIEQVYDDGQRLVTQGVDGRFALSVAAGRRLVAGLEAPRHRVVVGDESVPFVREGRSAFAKFVTDVDPGLRPGDEVAVLHDDEVLGVGRAELAADAMADFDAGVAVHVRHGADD